MAIAFSWTGYVDTDLSFSEFFNADHTLSLRFMTQCPRGYEGPCVAENGTGTFVLGQGYYFHPPEGSTLPGSPRLYFAIGEQWREIKVSLEPNRWYQLALVAKVGPDASYFELYRDGTWLGQIVLNQGAAGMPSGTLRFGKRTTGQTVNTRNAQFYGLLADVGIFTRALDVDELKELAKPGKGFTGSEAGLLAAYPLSSGAAGSKLSRPVTLHGLTRTIGTSADGDSTGDAALIPLQTRQQPMDLPFKLGEIWYAGQAWDGTGSHNGLAEFCWDLTRDGGTDGVMLVSAAPGEVAEVRESAPSGKSEYANHVDIKQAENEFASYIHLKQNQVPVAKGDLVTQGQEIGKSGDTGTGVGNFHLHFAVSDKPDLTEGFVTIPVAFSDYEVRREGESTWTPVARGAPIDGDTIRNPPTPAFAGRSLGPGSAVSRGTSQLDLVATDSQGRIWIARWVPRRYFNNWDRWRPVLSDLGATRPVGVASRSSGRLDIVSAHAAGSIHTGGWNRDYNYGLWGGWWRIKDLVARGNAPVSIVARDADKLDVFCASSGGDIMTAAWDQDVAGGAWRGWWPVAGGETVPGGWVTAVARTPNHLDVFMVGRDGGVYTAAWQFNVAGGAWRGWWRIRDLEALPGSHVAAVSRHPDKLDVFAVRTDGAIMTAAWEQNVANSAWRGWWWIAEGRTSASTPVTAVSRHPDRLDVFVVGSGGGVHTAAWGRGVENGAWRGWWRIKDLVAIQGSAVAAVARDTGKLDVFAVRTNGQMSTAAWDRDVENGAWRGWWRIGT